MPLVLITLGWGRSVIAFLLLAKSGRKPEAREHLAALGPEFRRIQRTRALEPLRHRPYAQDARGYCRVPQPRHRIADHVKGAGGSAQHMEIAACRRQQRVFHETLHDAGLQSRLVSWVALVLRALDG